MIRRRELAGVLAAAVFVVTAAARADSPTDTTTGPVSTVTTLPSPTTPRVTTPTPDAAPVDRATHPRSKRVLRRSAPVVRRSVTTAPEFPLVRSSTSTPQRSSRPVVTVHPAKKKVVRHHHQAKRSPPRMHAAPASHVRPATKAPRPVQAPAPAPVRQSSGNSWFASALIGGLVALVVALVLVARMRAMRRREEHVTSLPVAPPPPPAVARVVAPATMIERDPEPPAGPELVPTAVVALPPDSCRIAWWRGYVRSRFYAYEENGGGEPKLVAESPLFSWHSNEPPPKSAAALAAYASLLNALEGLGWEPDGRGEDWFSARFRPAISVSPGRRTRGSTKAPSAAPGGPPLAQRTAPRSTQGG